MSDTDPKDAPEMNALLSQLGQMLGEIAKGFGGTLEMFDAAVDADLKAQRGRLEADDPPLCKHGHPLTVQRTEHACAPDWEALCQTCYDLDSPHGHGKTAEEAETDFFEQEWERHE